MVTVQTCRQRQAGLNCNKKYSKDILRCLVKKKGLTRYLLLYILIKVDVKKNYFTRGDVYGEDGKAGLVV